MPHISTLKAAYTKDAGLAVQADRFYIVDAETGEATPWNLPPYELPAALGEAGQVLAVNGTGDGLEWVDLEE